MADAIDLVKIIKKAASDAVRVSKPVEICYGKVTSASPLQILIEQKMTLGAAQLVLSRSVTDYTTEMTVEDERKKITVHNGLVVGDDVILLRQQGGQKYIVADRLK